MKYSSQHGRPPRLSDVFLPDPIYFVTICTWQKQALLADDAVIHVFHQAARAAQRHSVAFGKYVLMPDHVHCFVRVGREGSISLAVKGLKRAITKALHADQKNVRVWQEGFFDHVLRSSESYAEKWEYVRKNPVRAGMVARAEDWPFQGEVENLRW
ncbi:MAG: transposase [Kiritimatiellia bacterium]